jgi:hypothetical protein
VDASASWILRSVRAASSSTASDLSGESTITVSVSAVSMIGSVRWASAHSGDTSATASGSMESASGKT